MELRLKQEENEYKVLSRYAAKSSESKGRTVEEEKCDVRTDFQRDRDRILHSKAFRRLKDKTQVFISPQGDHLRTRLTHTLEVSQISRTIARALALNEDLTEAIALGHDLGHTPFGHGGEYTLNKICPFGFRHNEQSLRVVERLENDGQGLNLSFEVKDGIRNHRTENTPGTLEGKVVQLSDKIAYINHDVDDAVRAKALKLSDIPSDLLEKLGETPGKRINKMIRAVIESSMDQNDIIMDGAIKNEMYRLRDFMFEHVYLADYRKSERNKVFHIIEQLYAYYLKDGHDVLSEYANKHEDENESVEIAACDLISGMTDRFAMKTYMEIFMPQYWNVY